MEKTKRIMPLTILLLDYMTKAGFRLKRYIEEANGKISFSEGSYEDIMKYSKVLRNKGFNKFENNPDPIYKDIKSSFIENGKVRIIFTTDTSTKRTTLQLQEI